MSFCHISYAINVSVGRAGILQGYILRFKQCFPNHLSMNSKEKCVWRSKKVVDHLDRQKYALPLPSNYLRGYMKDKKDLIHSKNPCLVDTTSQTKLDLIKI